MPCDNICEIIENEKIIAILRDVDEDALIPTLTALREGGIKAAEIAFDSSKKIDDSVIVNQIKTVSEHFKDDMIIGAGTVVLKEQVKAVKEAGGKFIVSPNTDSEIIALSKELDLCSIPGAYSPSEIINADKSGADFVKIFPVNAYGPDGIKTLRAPIQNIKIMAVGNITLDDIRSYLNAGVTGFCIGGSLIRRDLIKAGKFSKLTKIAQEFSDTAKRRFDFDIIY